MTERPNPLCMVGAGYVGLVTAVCLADAGVDVRLLDIDPARLATLRQGRTPIHEPLLDDLLAQVLEATARSSSTTTPAIAMHGAAVIMIAVGTPPLGDGRADLTQVRAAVIAGGPPRRPRDRDRDQEHGPARDHRVAAIALPAQRTRGAR